MLRLTGQRSSPPASWHSAFGPRREHWCLVEVLGLRSDQPDARTGNFLVARWKNSTMILGVDNRADRGATLIHRKELLLLQSPPTVAENKASGSRLSSRQTSRTPSTEDEKRSRAGVRKTFVDEDRRRSWAPGHLFRAASPKVEYIMQRSREPCALDRKEGRRQRRKQDQGDVRRLFLVLDQEFASSLARKGFLAAIQRNAAETGSLKTDGSPDVILPRRPWLTRALHAERTGPEPLSFSFRFPTAATCCSHRNIVTFNPPKIHAEPLNYHNFIID
ncbi:uncharacterized protein LOC143350497 isoform X1 [Colletes latitarsis]|uniref:uncharacterized protein LOC143350497 isoform X1 n=1 Tax=Colletes latitarsis TaxID=2605962 RepID=UPI004035AAE1